MSAADLPCLDFAINDFPKVSFSYAQPNDSFFRKLTIRSIEFATGQPKLRKAYETWTRTSVRSETIFSAGMRLLGIKLETDGVPLTSELKTGGLLIIANHPFGVADGLAIGHLATQLRNDVKIMTHSLLCQPPEANKYLLPVDFSATRKAKLDSAATRKAALQWLEDGHCLMIFPAGGVATRPKPLNGKALDLPWHTFTAKLAAVPHTRVLPLFVHGENSTLFHLASHSWYPLRAALLFRETLRQAGQSIRISVGELIYTNELPTQSSKANIVEYLRNKTFALAGASNLALAQEFYWPGKPKF